MFQDEDIKDCKLNFNFIFSKVGYRVKVLQDIFDEKKSHNKCSFTGKLKEKGKKKSELACMLLPSSFDCAELLENTKLYISEKEKVSISRLQLSENVVKECFSDFGFPVDNFLVR